MHFCVELFVGYPIEIFYKQHCDLGIGHGEKSLNLVKILLVYISIEEIRCIYAALVLKYSVHNVQVR